MNSPISVAGTRFSNKMKVGQNATAREDEKKNVKSKLNQNKKYLNCVCLNTRCCASISVERPQPEHSIGIFKLQNSQQQQQQNAALIQPT